MMMCPGALYSTSHVARPAMDQRAADIDGAHCKRMPALCKIAVCTTGCCIRSEPHHHCLHSNFSNAERRGVITCGEDERLHSGWLWRMAVKR